MLGLGKGVRNANLRVALDSLVFLEILGTPVHPGIYQEFVFIPSCSRKAIQMFPLFLSSNLAVIILDKVTQIPYSYWLMRLKARKW